MVKLVRVKIEGQFYTLRQLAKKYHLPISTIRNRYYNHKRGHDLIRPSEIQKIYVHGQLYTFTQLAHKYHLPQMRLWNRYRAGYREDNLIEPKKIMKAHAKISGKTYTLHEISDKFHIRLPTLKERYYQQGERGPNLLSNPFPGSNFAPMSYDGEENIPDPYMDLDSGIQVLQKIAQIKFSKEQLAILKADYDHPIVVNACAGSGKTTIFIYRAILSMLIGKSDGQDTLGITFSKDAQREMQQRFYQIKRQLLKIGIKVPALIRSHPQFLTFHALFFHLLKKYQPNLKVLSNAESNPQFRHTSYRIIRRSYYDMDNQEVLRQVFTLRNEMINRGWSNDGISVPTYQDIDHPIQEVASHLNIPGHSQQFFYDYRTIIQKYQEMKQDANRVDFTDMKALLYQQMITDPAARRFYLNQMEPAQHIYLDEFQDIDRLQWKLMKALLSPSAQRGLFVIGDDDQAIYGFRGGSAHYIIHFTQEFPHAQQFHLSTNYRTDERVLNVARPMIKKNPVRIDKRLWASHHRYSKIYINYRNPHTTAQRDPIFYQLLRLVQNPQISNQDIVVLVRHNITRSMVADFLANHNIYPNLSHEKYILQFNKIYDTYQDLLYAMLYDNFIAFYHHTTEIGFRQYRQHVRDVIYHNKMELHQVHKMSTYSRLVLNTPIDSRMETIDQRIVRCFERAQEVAKDNPKQIHELLNELYRSIHSLVSSYYGYMVNKQFISNNDYQMTTNTLRENLLNDDFPTIDDFFSHEKQKAQRLYEVLNDQRQKSLDILTLHQAKGLQYSYVFLIGLDDTDFTKDSVKIDQLFPADYTYQQFLGTLHDQLSSFSHRNNTRKSWFPGSHKLSYQIWHTSKDEDGQFIPSAAFDNVYQLIVNSRYPPKKSGNEAFYISSDYYVLNHRHHVGRLVINSDSQGRRIPAHTQYIDRNTGEVLPLHHYMSKDTVNHYNEEIRNIYRDLIHQSAFVESERRLLYVGITRSRARLYLDIPASPSPLISELDLKSSIREHEFSYRDMIPHSNLPQATPERLKRPYHHREVSSDTTHQVESLDRREADDSSSPGHLDISIEQLSQEISDNSFHFHSNHNSNH